MASRIEDYALIGDCHTASRATAPSIGFASPASIQALVSRLSWAARKTAAGPFNLNTACNLTQ